VSPLLFVCPPFISIHFRTPPYADRIETGLPEDARLMFADVPAALTIDLQSQRLRIKQIVNRP